MTLRVNKYLAYNYIFIGMFYGEQFRLVLRIQFEVCYIRVPIQCIFGQADSVFAIMLLLLVGIHCCLASTGSKVTLKIFEWRTMFYFWHQEKILVKDKICVFLNLAYECIFHIREVKMFARKITRRRPSSGGRIIYLELGTCGDVHVCGTDTGSFRYCILTSLRIMYHID